MTAANVRPAPVTHEPSAWLRGRLAQLVNAATAAGLDPHNSPAVIVWPLGTTGRPGTRQDRACDRCDVYVPVSEPLHALTAWPARRMVVAGGLCTACARAEVAA